MTWPCLMGESVVYMWPCTGNTDSAATETILTVSWRLGHVVASDHSFNMVIAIVAQLCFQVLHMLPLS